MDTVLFIVGLLCSLASFVCTIIILIAAFKEEVVQGLLCLCVPFYVLYYAFVRFENDNKTLIIAVWLGGSILGAVIQVAAGAAAAGV